MGYALSIVKNQKSEKLVDILEANRRAVMDTLARA